MRCSHTASVLDGSGVGEAVNGPATLRTPRHGKRVQRVGTQCVEHLGCSAANPWCYVYAQPGKHASVAAADGAADKVPHAVTGQLFSDCNRCLLLHRNRAQQADAVLLYLIQQKLLRRIEHGGEPVVIYGETYNHACVGPRGLACNALSHAGRGRSLPPHEQE